MSFISRASFWILKFFLAGLNSTSAGRLTQRICFQDRGSSQGLCRRLRMSQLDEILGFKKQAQRPASGKDGRLESLRIMKSYTHLDDDERAVIGKLLCRIYRQKTACSEWHGIKRVSGSFRGGGFPRTRAWVG